MPVHTRTEMIQEITEALETADFRMVILIYIMMRKDEPKDDEADT